MTSPLNNEVAVDRFQEEERLELEPVAEDEVYVFPTSFAQRRLWFLDQFEPGSPYYNIPSAVRLRGRLDVRALERSVEAIVERHESLRTTFAMVDGEPVQVISPRSNVRLAVADLRPIDKELREKEALDLANREARRPFDLSTGPLFRVTLLVLDDDDNVLLLTMHHIVSDGWSMGVLIEEISTLYDAFSKGQPSPLPELPIQYADFAEWQREWLSGAVLEEQLNYWKERLGDIPPVLELPTDRPRPAVQSSRGSEESIVLPRDLTDRLKALGKEEGATLFMTLLAAFKALLYRYTGQEDISVGTPIANRNRGELERLIGFFVNTLVLRTDLSGDPSFREIVRRVREVALGAYAHQDLPFEMLVEALSPERDMSHNPLFQVMFILQNAPVKAKALHDVTLEMLDLKTGTSTFDLTMAVAESVSGLSVSVEYNTDIFDASTIRRLLRHYWRLLEGVTADPDAPVSRVDLLLPEEKHQILVEWNDTKREFRPEALVHKLFEARVEEAPEATAVSFLGQTLTYRELNERANQLAHHLRTLGVGPEVPVGIATERSLDMIVAVLGVLKSGGAYLPLDPAYPKERLAYMLQDSGAPVLVTQEHLLDSLPQHEGRLVLLDSGWDEIAKQPAENPPNLVVPENLVYTIYTSGSTGRSKGVMVQHRSLANAYLAWEEPYELRTRARAHLQMASFSFDVFSGDLVRALCSGGKLVLTPREFLLEPEKLYALMRKEQVTIAEFVPAVLRTLVQYLEESGQDLSFMRILIAGSDVWYVGEYERFKKLCGPETRLINSFGLTEATIDSTFFEGDLSGVAVERLVPIGRPFANSRIYILDRNLQPTPIGVPGEICVAGPGLARGYRNRPDLTAEKFIPDAFSGEMGARLYRTGDLARYLPDGNIEFLGRVDTQVKIRGYRIELGEIEAALSAHDAIRQVAVIVREDKPGDKRIVAYFVAAGGVSPTPGELRRYLLDRLPEYMVPSAFVELEALPLTPNGKIDRKALPKPDESARGFEETFVAPRTPTEEVVAGIWAEILGLEKIGVHDNFFELGGHSLLATQVISRIREAFQLELPLRNIFESPTVATLAEQIDLAKQAAEGLEEPPIKRVPREGPLPLSFAQQRLWFLEQLEPGSPFYNIPDAVRIKGNLRVDVLERAINEIIRRHESLRTRFDTVDGKPVQVILPELHLNVPVVDLTGVAPDKREALALALAREDAQRPFSLTNPPLLRVTLLKMSERDHVVLFTTHHIVSDNWSSNVLIQEVAALYDAFLHGKPSPLPELPIQYADFAVWQREWLQGEVLEKHLDYWKKQLEGAPPVLELPTDRPRPSVQTYNGAYQTFELSAELSRAIREFSQANDATLFMTLLAAFGALLAKYSRQRDILVGTPIANRNRAEIEGLIGFFVNTLVLRTDLSGDPSFEELVQRVREVALDAYAHQDVPFEQLVEVLQPERDMSHSPLFQVMFALQNAPFRAQEISSDLVLEPVEAHSGTAKFDLTLFMVEEGERLGGAFEYNTDLFDDETISRMIRHFVRLLELAVAEPDKSVLSLDILDEEERTRVVQTWNGPSVVIPSEETVLDLIQRQVADHAEDTAVVQGEVAYSYAELDRRSDLLAGFLQRVGVGRESVVAIYQERSPDLIVSLLAVLKAGGAYLPMDPSYPAERIRYMLEDSDARVVLTQARVADSLPLIGAELVLVDLDWDEVEFSGTRPVKPRLSRNDLAYVIYTSGSTGRPKGTLVTHGGLRNYLEWVRRAYPVDRGIGSVVHSTIAFDATVTAVFSPLVSGKRVVLAPVGDDVEALARVLREQGDFSLIKITPAHLDVLRQQLTPEQARRATHAFIIGGENLTTEQIRFWLDAAPDTELYNEYGPTETVVGCVVYKVPKDWRGSGSVPIGRAIPNTRVYILDERMTLCPQGVPGELYIGGAGVARGYLNRPDLTAEKFVPDPFSGEAGARLYRSGDLVRYRNDGQMEFLGRLDDQVKIRGYRIELGEIEGVLSRHDKVEQAVVLAREDRPGDRRLVAYVVPKQGAELSSKELREFLQKQLPDYMIPAAFVELESLPLTPNGKIDRRALPVPDYTTSGEEHQYVAPRTPVEELLAGIWEEALGLKNVGALDNFFEIGGHSLLATQVVSRIRETLGVELPIRVFFERPTVAGMAQEVERLVRESRGVSAPPLVKVERTGAGMPLSYAQERLWFLDQLEPGSAVYNISEALRFEGSFRPDVFVRSLAWVVERHEVLRTTFAEEDGVPVQVIHDEITLPVREIDLTSLPAAQAESEVRRLIRLEARRGFDLQRGPLFRVTLVQMPDGAWVVVVVMHHIISDGWSMGVMIREVGQAYEAFLRNTKPAASPLPVQYADFSAWQRSWLRGEVLEQELDYWKNQLSGAEEALELPTDRPRPAVKTFNGDKVTFEFGEDLSERIRELSRREGVTPFMTLLGAWQALLSRLSGQDDVSVGSVIANRNRVEIENLIGFFVNTLVFRTDLSGDPSFRELLQRVRDVALGAYAHQDVPFEKVVEAVQPERDLSHTPLFQVMFVLQNMPAVGGGLGESVRVEGLDADTGLTQYDLTLSMQEGARGLEGMLEYNTDLFDRETAERLVRYYRRFLEIVTGEPETHLSAVDFLEDWERHRLLVEWNDTVEPLEHAGCVHEWFERVAQRHADNVAVLYEGRKLTYGELDRQSNQLSRYLRGLGVRADTPVGICVERSPQMIVGMLGVMKAGGAYVPLDPSYPPERLGYMVEDSGIHVVLTQESLTGFVRGFGAGVGTVVALDADWPKIAGLSDEPVSSGVFPENLAYIIYTSGSTGRPKGVMLAHRGLVNLVQAQTRAFGVTPESKVLQFASFSFDASVSETFMALLRGATLVLAPQEKLMDVEQLHALLRDEKITVVTLPPSVSRLVPIEGLEALQTLISAGEACTPDIVEKWAPGRRLFNAYGPTEATVGPTLGLVDSLPAWAASAPIGRPISNVQIFILDRNLRPVPTGVPGEICVGGVGLARGYRNRPDLTAEKFVPNPFATQPGERLYRTGDLGRFLPDGRIEFLGRVDDQVKVRGYRIELGEIEGVLSQHDAVGQCAVVVREDRPGDRRLVAYVVPSSPEAEISRAALRQYLADRLPDYMVPSAVVLLESLPLTPNGKVNRRALPAPDYSADGQETGYVAPRTPMEELVAGLWEELLGASRVGAGDNFFEIGGHSLLATQVVSRLRDTLGVEVPIRVFFEQPTVEGLARTLEELVREQRGVSAPPLVPAERTGEGLPLSFAQERLWFLHQLEPENAVYNITEALRFSGDFDPVAFVKSLARVVERHEVLRTTFAEASGRPVQIVQQDFRLPVVIVDLSHLNETEATAEIQRQTKALSRRPFDLKRGPLFRVTLFAFPSGDWGVVVVMHHIISDGWSMGVLIRELGAVYAALKRGEAISLPELPIQYGDFAAWQRAWLRDEVLEKELDYWRKQLGDSSGYLELPTDRPRPAVKTFRGSKITFELDPELSGKIRALGKAEGTTLFMTLLGAWQALLSRYSGQTDVSVGSVIANRNRRETEGLIGFFVNTLVFRTDLSGNPTFREILRRVRDVSLGAYAHQDVPFEKVVEAVQPERDLSHTPLFQVMFVLQNMPLSAGGLGEGVRVESLDADSGLTQYDLTLSMQELGKGQLGGILEYNTDLFDRETVEALAGHFVNLLDAVASDPDKRLNDVELLQDWERHQLLVEWNDTRRPVPAEACLHELFEKSADQWPGALALIAGNQTYTYREIEERANRLARFLRREGVGPDVLVGVGLPKSADLLVAVLAVLKAGGAYVPLDPAYPLERLRFMISDTRMPLLLTRSDLASHFPGDVARILKLDLMGDLLSTYPSKRLDSVTTGDNLAYVIYTSGSTGTPKGVMAIHRGIVNLAEGFRNHFGLKPGHRVLEFFSFSFDGATIDLFAPLHAGGTVCFPDEEAALPGPALERFIREKQIRMAILPPSALTVMNPESLECLEVVGSAGDVCTKEIVEKWAPGRKFYNGYGPTETTVAATFHRVSERDVASGSVPIGTPCANVSVYVVDENLRPVPRVVPGELLVGGRGVTRGYLNRPDLTAEKFIPDPFGDEPGARLYRTGDLVRWLPDGRLEFLGRIDGQVKVRGFRIEIGEVESALQEHPEVAQAAVVARDAGGTKELVAFVVPANGAEIDTSKLRAFLAMRLPDYMLPSGFVQLNGLPLLPSGKVDRTRLARMDAEVVRSGVDYVAPRNELEEQLQRIWEEVLGRDSIGVHDSFFDVGGHSLLAIRLLNEIESRFGKQVPLVQLFQKPTIEGLAEYLESGQRASSALVPFNDPGEGTPLFFIHPSGGSVHWYADLARALGPEQPFFGIKAQGAEGEAPFHETIEEMAAHAVRAMRSRQPHGPYFFGSWSMGVVIAYEAAQQLVREGEEVALLAMLDQGPEFPSAVPDDDTEFLAGMFGPRLKLNLKKLRKMPYDEQLQFVLKKAKKARLLPPNVKDEQFGDYVRLLKTEMMAWKRYHFESYPGKIVVFRSSERPETQDEPWDLGWEKLAQGGVEVFVVPGNHNTILWKPNVEELAEVLQTIVGSQRAVK